MKKHTNSDQEILIKLDDSNAVVPTKGYEGDAGFDLRAIEDVTILPHKQCEVNCGIKIAIPKGYFGLILTRSSYGKQQIQVHHGVIDSGYRGLISVFIYNLSDKPFSIKKGDKIAQLVILPVPNMKFKKVVELPNSKRGEKGFGSTGK